MFVFDFREWKVPDISAFKNNITTELSMLQNQITVSANYKEKIFACFANLSIKEYVNVNNISFINSLNEIFNFTNENLDELSKLKEKLIAIKSYVDSTNFYEYFDRDRFLVELESLLEDYYYNKNVIQSKVLENSCKINSFIDFLTKCSIKKLDNKAKFTGKISHKKAEVIENKIEVPDEITNNKAKVIENNVEIPDEITNNKAEVIENNVEIPDKITNNKTRFIGKIPNKKTEVIKDKKILNDNKTLIISEKDGKVYLPYLISDLEKILKYQPKYETIENLINEEYILPINTFKNPILSRFREAYRLMRVKENASIAESISLGFELMTNYKLHPAVIAACRNEDELEIYLDCLFENELDDFDIFNIRFDISPIKV